MYPKAPGRLKKVAMFWPPVIPICMTEPNSLMTETSSDILDLRIWGFFRIMTRELWKRSVRWYRGCDGMKKVFLGLLLFVMLSTIPPRSTGVNDILGIQVKRRRNRNFSRLKDSNLLLTVTLRSSYHAQYLSIH